MPPVNVSGPRARRFLVLMTILAGGFANVQQTPILAAPPSASPPPFLTESTNPRVAIAVAAPTPASGFSDTVVWSGLASPTALRFAPNGSAYVAEKSGLIKVFDSLADTTPSVVADLQPEVHNFWDRGLLGMALGPSFAGSPSIYVLYSLDAPIGGTPPTWNDACPKPPGATTDGCVIGSRLSRLTINGGVSVAENVLIEDWCQQYPSHSAGDLRFGADGALYVSHGEGASFTGPDYGQLGGSLSGTPTPKNPCGDPPAGSGGTQTPPTAEGGALRSQSVRRPSGEPVSLDGALLRLDPSTGAAMSGNPLIGSSDPNAQRIVAYGIRNAFRFAIRPGTNDVWLGDVGANNWEEIDRVPDPLAGPTNLGWPCYEGAARDSTFEALNLASCSSLYAAPAVAAPEFAYSHSAKVVPGETCPTGSSSITGMAFLPASNSYPVAYAGSLFFADHARRCIWAMAAGTDGLPDPTAVSTFVTSAANPVDLETGPNGDLFYVDLEGGAVHRISFAASNQPPIARIVANPVSGPSPLTVAFDGTTSSDPEGAGLTYAWDLDNDGQFDDSTLPNPSKTFATSGTQTVRLQVTDPLGAHGVSSFDVLVDDALPTPVIDTPTTSLHWSVGDPITFSGHATDGTGAAIPAADLSWTLVLNHCPSNCHTHAIQSWAGTAGGSFSAPDHDYPSSLTLTLTATDSSARSASTSIQLDPNTVDLTFQTSPPGLALVLATESEQATPFTKRVIVNSSQTMTAASPQALGSTHYAFQSWSDAGQISHAIDAPTTGGTYTATFKAVPTPAFDATKVALSLSLLQSGFNRPLQATSARDGTNRLFVVEQTGKVKIIPAGGGAPMATPYLDLTGSILYDGGERGLLGIAFHPNFATYPYVYVDFTDIHGNTAISRYTVSRTDPNVLDRSTGVRTLTIPQPYPNHKGGNLAFGPDGYLYIGMGDGGSGGDPGNRAQNINTLLGKMLRIDVNHGTSTRHYKSPASNPYVGKAGLDEIWSRGLRNPWRWSFDRLTRQLWIGDVGQDRYEEVDRSNPVGSTPAGRAANYGWRVLEGRACFNPPTHCSTTGKVSPLVVYTHSASGPANCSITGGFVYRGSAYPVLTGGYLFGDYCSGRIWGVSSTAATPATPTLLRGPTTSPTLTISSFGEDEAGELYVVDLGGGNVYRITATVKP